MVRISSEIAECSRCEISATRLNTVPGEGDIESSIVLVGEAPGKKEDELGRPFVGRAGILLDDLLESVGLHRTNFYILNILKCRPPKNRRPKKSEVVKCESYLRRQLEVLKPRVIAPMGNSSLSFFQGMFDLDKEVIGEVHGKAVNINTNWGTALLFPLYHPAAAIYNRLLLNTLKEDLEKLIENL